MDNKTANNDEFGIAIGRQIKLLNYELWLPYNIVSGFISSEKLKILNFTLTVTLSQFFYFINEITNSEKGVIY